MDKNGRKDKDNDSDVQIKVDSDEDGDWETEIGKNPPPKKKTFFAFCDGFTKSSARDKKWIQCEECLVWAQEGAQMLKLTCMFVNTANKY